MKNNKILIFLLIMFNFSCYSKEIISVNVITFGATPNDNKDDTKSFQKAADYLASKKGGKIIIPKGCYNITHLLFMGKKYSNILILGDSSTILQTVPFTKNMLSNGSNTFALRNAADGCFVFDANVSNKKNDLESIKNVTIKGINFLSDVIKGGFDELLHQISAHGVSNFKVEDCNFTGFYGDGIAVNGATDFSKNRNAYNKDVIIKNCKFDGLNNDNRQGISIYYSDGFVIDNCHFQNVTRSDMPGAIDIEPDTDSNVSRNGRIINCSFKNIGGLAAIMIHTRKSTSKNNFSNKNFVIVDCIFDNVRAPLCVVGNENYLKFNSTDYVVHFKNSIVRNTECIADMRSAFGVCFNNIKYFGVTNPALNTVTDVGANKITFQECFFSNVSNNNGIGFYGETRNINFKRCIFKNFVANAITINDPKGLGSISGNIFESSSYPNAYPVVTSTIKNISVISRSYIGNNKTFGNFRKISLQDFYEKR